MAKYTDKFKATAVITLQAAGYPSNPYKLEQVAKNLGVPSRSLRRWYNAEVGAPSDETVIEVKKDMTEDLQRLAWKLIAHAGDEDVIDEMSGQSTITSIGILIDKIRLLTGLPTEIIGIMPEFVSAIQKTGQKPEDVMRRFIERSSQRDNIKQ